MEQGGYITDVDLRSPENNQAHRTIEIDQRRLIVRRGQPFSIGLQCSESSSHGLALALQLGKKEEIIIKPHKDGGERHRWSLTRQGGYRQTLLTVQSPADAIIGHYKLTVLFMSPDGRVLQKSDKHDFHLLFNPWCKDDTAYFPNENQLREYILNEDGIIFNGSWNVMGARQWNFGQFEDDVMDICFEILDNSNEALSDPQRDLAQRGDPVYISRIVSAMVNSNGDRGVITGCWDKEVDSGTPPSKWCGSVEILRQWSRSKARPVKYGQCWVFAAIGVTVMRCLGIATRLITNFQSAHDSDGNLIIEEFIDAAGQHSDSIWNFHCWIESWMKRIDLPSGNDGWQVLDPTPQEPSTDGGGLRCGPCPVKAVKEGNLDIKYDASFVFAEVNADVQYWRICKDGKREKVSVDQSRVGKCISTKSCYGDGREDVTLTYKYPEGSREEREVYKKAMRKNRDPSAPEPDREREREQEREQTQLSVKIKHSKAVFGTDFDVIIEVANSGTRDLQGQLTIMGLAVMYNSLHQTEFKRHTVNIKMPARRVHKEIMRLHYEEYSKCISDHHLIRMKAFLEVMGENQPLMNITNIPMNMPELVVKVSGGAYLSNQITAQITVFNPLPVPLRRGVFTLEGAGLLPVTVLSIKEEIPPGRTATIRHSFVPLRSGTRKLLVDFDADRLKDVKGVATVMVHKQQSRFAIWDNFFR